MQVGSETAHQTFGRRPDDPELGCRFLADEGAAVNAASGISHPSNDRAAAEALGRALGGG